MAVVPPIPKASVNTAAAVKTGDNLNCRRAYRKLPGKLCMEHLSLLYVLESRQVPKAGNRRTLSAVRRTSAECCLIDDSRSRLSRSCNREENPVRGLMSYECECLRGGVARTPRGRAARQVICHPEGT